jgi:hypothetical protein
VIERFVINLLWKGIISCLWVQAGARLDILWKGNIAFLWVLKNDFIYMFQTTLILVDHETGCIRKITSLSFHA